MDYSLLLGIEKVFKKPNLIETAKETTRTQANMSVRLHDQSPLDLMAKSEDRKLINTRSVRPNASDLMMKFGESR